MLVQEGGSIIVAGQVMQHIALAGKRFPVNHRASSQTIELKKIEDAGVEVPFNNICVVNPPKRRNGFISAETFSMLGY